MTAVVEVSAVIERIYDAAFDPSAWQPTLREIAGLTGGSSAAFMVQNARRHEIHDFQFSDMDPQAWIDYRDHYVKYDLWRDRLMSAKGGAVLQGEAIVPREELLRSPWYNEFLVKNNIGQLLVAIAENDHRFVLGLSVFRPLKAPEPTSRQMQLMGLLAPHLEQACRLGRALQRSLHVEKALLAALHNVSAGVVLLDGMGRPLWFNRAVGKTLAQQDGLKLSPAGIELVDPKAGRRLDCAVQAALKRSQDEFVGAPASLHVPRPSGRLSYELMIFPLSRSRAERMDLAARARPALLVYIWDPSRRRPVSTTVLARRFDLTPAEARLTVAMAEGISLQDYAEQATISVDTARSHLKEVFQKTSTHRQAELTHLICQLQPPLDDGG